MTTRRPQIDAAPQRHRCERKDGHKTGAYHAKGVATHGANPRVREANDYQAWGGTNKRPQPHGSWRSKLWRATRYKRTELVVVHDRSGEDVVNALEVRFPEVLPVGACSCLPSLQNLPSSDPRTSSTHTCIHYGWSAALPSLLTALRGPCPPPVARRP